MSTQTRVGSMDSSEDPIAAMLAKEPEQDFKEESVLEGTDMQYGTYADPEPEEELWPGGPIFADIEKWKVHYGDIYVTSVTPDTHFVWRTIRRAEYRSIVMELEKQIGSGELTQAEATMNNEEAIAATCILFPRLDPKRMGEELAGVAAIISQEVLEASAFQALEVRQL